jgi:O-antigen/teichoic acid export membrane protein
MSLFLTISKLFKANMFYAILGLFISVVIARELGPQLKGELTLFFLISSIFGLSMRFGLDTAIIRFLKINPTDFAVLKHSIYLVLIILFFLFILFLTTIFFDIAPILFQVKEYHYFLYFLVPLEVVSILIASYLLGSNKIAQYSCSIIIQPTVLCIVIGLFFIFKIELTVFNIIAMTVFSFTIKLIYLLVVTKYFDYKKKNYSLKKSFYLLKFGIKSHIGNVMDFFIIRTDILLISFFIGLEAVGIYSIAALAEKINIINSSIGSAVFSKIKCSKDTELVNLIIRATLPLLIIMIIVAMLLSEYFIILVFGENFKDSCEPFIILLIGFSILFISKPIKAYLVIIDKPGLLTVASILSLACNVTLNILLIPKHGLMGAAIATSLANFIYVITLLFYYKKYSNAQIKSIILCKKNDLKEIFR